jgi:photosystem II stability/assembly factor-like uncharacterized protein
MEKRMKPLKLFLCMTVIFLTSCDKKNLLDSAASAGTPLNYELIASGTTNNLHSVFFINSQTGYIAGDSGLVLKTSDGGTVWTPATPVTKQNLYCVTFSSIDTGYAFGDSLTVLKTTNGGSIWKNLFSGSHWDYHLKTGFCMSGQQFEIAGYHFIGFSNNGGTTIYFYPSTYYYRAMKRLLDSISIVVGDNGVIGKRTGINNTNSWNTITSPTSNNLNGLAFVNDNIGFAVGDNGTLIRSEDSGNIWHLMTSLSSDKLNDIHFMNPSKGVIIGNNSLFYATSDSGKNWWQYSILPLVNLNSTCTIDGQKRIIVGDGGTILREN